MSEHPIDDLPSDLTELLEREASAHPEDTVLKETVLHRVEMSLALATPMSVAGMHSAGSAGRVVGARIAAVIGVGAFAAGVTVGTLAANRTAAPAPAGPVVVAASQPTTTAVSQMPSIATPRFDPLPTAPSASVAIEIGQPRDKPNGDLVRERERLDFARSALDHDDPTEAIAALDYHARKWPHGYLAEEREVIWIQALAKSARWAEAQKRAAAFRQTYPTSVFAGTVDAAVGPANGPSFVTDSGTR